jgi:hypothetical protein
MVEHFLDYGLGGNAFELQFGAYGNLRITVIGCGHSGLSTALDHAADEMMDVYPGIFCELTEEDEEADHSPAGGFGRYVVAHEWHGHEVDPPLLTEDQLWTPPEEQVTTP